MGDQEAFGTPSPSRLLHLQDLWERRRNSSLVHYWRSVLGSDEGSLLRDVVTIMVEDQRITRSVLLHMLSLTEWDPEPPYTKGHRLKSVEDLTKKERQWAFVLASAQREDVFFEEMVLPLHQPAALSHLWVYCTLAARNAQLHAKFQGTSEGMEKLKSSETKGDGTSSPATRLPKSDGSISWARDGASVLHEQGAVVVDSAVARNVCTKAAKDLLGRLERGQFGRVPVQKPRRR